MKKLLLILIGIFIVLPTFALEFKYTYEGQTLNYSTTPIEGEVSVGSSQASGDLIIPEIVEYNGQKYKVTSIKEWGFVSCLHITEVLIPNSISSIGKAAFLNCQGLTSVVIPNSVTEIGESAFNSCINLNSVIISNSLTTIAPSLFEYCENLKSVKIPNSVTTIGESAFSLCYGLTSVTIPNSVRSIGSFAFFSCRSLSSVIIPDSVISISESAFLNCRNITSVTIPMSITLIGNWVFEGCSGLRSIYYNTGTPIEGLKSIFSDSESGNIDNIYDNATLYVPKATIEKCQDIEPWKYFKNIQAFEFSGLDECIVDQDASDTNEIYNLNGVYVGNSTERLACGLYIVRQGHTVSKIAVK